MEEATRVLAESIVGRGTHAAVLGLFRPVLSQTLSPTSATKFTQHPYGFFTLKLGQPANIGDVVVHIWPPGQRVLQSPHWPVHCHPWHMRSRIMCGALTNETYEVSRSADGSRHLYEARVGQGFSALEATPFSVSCHRVASNKYEAGADYSVAKGVYHATLVEESILTVTVMITWGTGVEPPTVVGEKGSGAGYLFERRSIDLVTLRNLLERLRAEFGLP